MQVPSEATLLKQSCMLPFKNELLNLTTLFYNEI